MPLFTPSPMPQQRPYVPYAGQPVPATGAPVLPDPSLASQPPAQQPMTANNTGGPTSAQGALREGVYSHLYRLGRQASGKANMFAGFGPQQPPAAPDPLAALTPPAEEPQRVMPQLPPSPVPPIPADLGMGPQAQPVRPIDRFPRAARLMGRPQLPSPDARMY